MKTTKTISLALSLALVGCAEQAPTTGLPCPCSTGYVCCGDNVCVPEGDACSMRDDLPGQAPTTTTDRPCTATEDTNGDGTIDLNWTFFYDGGGDPVRQEGALPDGSPYALHVFTYNAIGQVTSMQYSLQGTEQYDGTSTYDAMGRLHTLTVTSPQFAPTTETWSYSGLVATQDTSFPGHPDIVMTAQEDAAGKPQSATVTEGGTQIGTDTFGWNPDGTISFVETDDATGALVGRNDWTYNANGLLTMEAGTGGSTTTYTYDAQGRQATITSQLSSTSAPDITTNHYCD